MTGNSDYNLRGGVNYRNQWNSVTIPFVSQSAYVDGKLSTRLFNSSWLGVGGMLFNDKAGEGNLKTNQVQLASSINKSLNAGNTLFVHFGTSVEFVNKSVDYDKLSFEVEDRLQGKQSLFYADFSLGSLVTYFKGANRYFMGMALSHINQPQESFYKKLENPLSTVSNNLKRKFAWHGGMEGRITPRLFFRPEFMFTSEKGANEWILGSNFYMPYGKRGIVLNYGLWYRFSQDIIPVFGFQKKKLKLLISYDINVSRLATATSNRGGLEISLTYNYNYSNPREVRKLKRKQRVKRLGNKAISCPKFSHED
jgi:type IX secretion system PorP/SprF family membrane protein